MLRSLSNICYSHLQLTFSSSNLYSGINSNTVAIPDIWKGKYNLFPKELLSIFYTQLAFLPELALFRFKEEKGTMG